MLKLVSILSLTDSPDTMMRLNFLVELRLKGSLTHDIGLSFCDKSVPHLHILNNR